MDKFISEIEEQLSELNKKLFSKVEQLARQALREDDNLLSFCMAMGSISFKVECWWDDEGDFVSIEEHLHPLDIQSDSKALEQICQLNDLICQLNIAGMPLKIDSKDAPSLTDW